MPLQSNSSFPLTPPLDVGYSSRPLFARDWKFYFSIQFLIFVKVMLFYAWLGHGVSYVGLPTWINVPIFATPKFESWLNVVDWVFHQSMHALIFIWVFLMAKHITHVRVAPLLGLFGIAVVLHNVGYWLTRAHPSLAYSLFDFVSDYAILCVIFAVLYVGVRAFPFLKRVRVPFLES